MKERLEQIRRFERDSHIEIYSTKELYESGSWLQKPIKTVLDIVPMFEEYQELHILDLGSGVGRNSIPFAQKYAEIPCTIECVDILELAIEKLKYNAEKYNVASSIKGIVAPIEEYSIPENSYDLIMAISALEHINSEEAFIAKLREIQAGIRENGIVCLIINSNVVEKDKATGKGLAPQFEVNLPTAKLQSLLEQSFKGWEKIKATVSVQHYDIPREKGVVELTSNVVTLVARNLCEKV